MKRKTKIIIGCIIALLLAIPVLLILLNYTYAGFLTSSGIYFEEKTTRALNVSLYEYDGNPDIVLGDELMANEAGLVDLTADMVFIKVYIPDGAVTTQIFYAKAGSEETAQVLFLSTQTPPRKNASDSEQLPPSGCSFSAADRLLSGVVGSIWAVSTDINGVEYESNIVNVIWKSDNR
jgi:hypothetical protein